MSTSAPTEPPADDPVLRVRVQTSLDRQGMMRHLGVQLRHVARGTATLSLPYSERATQQQGGFHGGAMGALADIAGGYAALTLAPEGMEVTTVEFKINFLAAFQNGELHATGRVLRAGKRIIVTQAEVRHLAPDGRWSDCAVMQQTIMPVPKTY
ncbi:MAG: PaaI family thioesterase [Proteobacteria bacterium]|nr:PaaI family thioesterase [Pseudomonadota bacterium]